MVKTSIINTRSPPCATPVVLSFHYPIFWGITSAKLIFTGSGWSLRDEDIRLWASVEFIMLKLIEAIAPTQLAPLGHVEPSSPEKFGYKRLHQAKYFTLKAKTTSLNAFQQMLVYCSYSVAGVPKPQLGSVWEECRSLLLHPEKLNHVFNYIGAGAPNTEIHVLVKFLWVTLGEIHRASNLVSIVVHHHKGYDYPSVRAMHQYGVPVYISWDMALKVTLGARGPGTSDYMLRTLRSLVKFNWLLISNNILGTFQMQSQLLSNMKPLGTFLVHLECNLNITSTCNH